MNFSSHPQQHQLDGMRFRAAVSGLLFLPASPHFLPPIIQPGGGSLEGHAWSHTDPKSPDVLSTLWAGDRHRDVGRMGTWEAAPRRHRLGSSSLGSYETLLVNDRVPRDGQRNRAHVCQVQGGTFRTPRHSSRFSIGLMAEWGHLHTLHRLSAGLTWRATLFS